MDYFEHYKLDALEFDYWGEDQFSATEKRRNQAVFELSSIRPVERVLDIGSGRGWFCNYAAKLGANVTALDLSEENLKKIKELNPDVNIIFGDAINPSETDEKYDLIAALEVLEHLTDPKSAVQNWKKLLRENGRLLITVPNKETIRYTLCIHCNRKTPVNAHLHSFSQDSLIKLLNQNGFWVKQTRLFSHKAMGLLHINNLSSRLPYKFWKRLDRFCGIFSRNYSYLACVAVVKEKG